jgi:hypothetical protein
MSGRYARCGPAMKRGGRREPPGGRHHNAANFLPRVHAAPWIHGCACHYLGASSKASLGWQAHWHTKAWRYHSHGNAAHHAFICSNFPRVWVATSCDSLKPLWIRIPYNRRRSAPVDIAGQYRGTRPRKSRRAAGMMWQDWVMWISIVTAICGLLFNCFALTVKRDMRGMPLNLWSRWYHGLFGASIFMISLTIVLLRLILAGMAAPSYYKAVIPLSFASVVLVLFAALALRQSWIQSSQR